MLRQQAEESIPTFGGNRGVAVMLAFALIASSAPLPGIAQAPSKPMMAAPSRDVDGMLDQSYRSMYNLQFDEALRQTEAASLTAPDDPVPLMAQACAVLFREFDRLRILRSELFGSDDRFSDGPAMAWD